MITRQKEFECTVRKNLFRTLFEQNETFKEEFYETNQLNIKNFPAHIQSIILLKKSKLIVEKLLRNEDILKNTKNFLMRNKSDLSDFAKQQLERIKDDSDKQTFDIITGIIRTFVIDTILRKLDI